MVVLLAVWSAVTFKEVLGAQLLVAMRAGEVLRVPGLAQGCDHPPHDGFVAGGAAALLCGGNALLSHVAGQRAEHRIKLVRRRGRGCRRGFLRGRHGGGLLQRRS